MHNDEQAATAQYVNLLGICSCAVSATGYQLIAFGYFMALALCWLLFIEHLHRGKTMLSVLELLRWVLQTLNLMLCSLSLVAVAEKNCGVQ